MAAFLVFAQTAFAEAELGIGVVSVRFDDKTVLQLYEQTSSKKPARTIQFFDDRSINSWNIVDLRSVRTWLSPESLWLDYGSFVLRCRSKKAGWLQVIVNNSTGLSYWVRSSPQLKFKSWEDYLKEMFSVTRKPKYPQKILTRPVPGARELRYSGKDCFEVKAMRGDWIQIHAADHCEGASAAFESGWIRWRRSNILLIDYFITS